MDQSTFGTVFHSVYDHLFQPYTYMYPPPHMTNMYPPPHITVFHSVYDDLFQPYTSEEEAELITAINSTTNPFLKVCVCVCDSLSLSLSLSLLFFLSLSLILSLSLSLSLSLTHTHTQTHTYILQLLTAQEKVFLVSGTNRSHLPCTRSLLPCTAANGP